MAKRTTKAAQIIDDALAADPHIPTATLVKRLLKLHPKCWPTKNACDCAVRKQRGAQGEKNRRWTPYTARPHEESETCRKWGALIPDAEPTEWGWRELPKGPRRWLIMSDIHLPYHDKAALQCVMQHADGNCDGVLLLGDILDFYQASHFEKDPEKRDLAGEFEIANRFLDAIKSGLKPRSIVWKGGNHEMRLPRYLMSQAPEAWPLLKDRVSIETLCNLPQRGIVWVRPQDPIRHHQLVLIHGHEQGNRFSSPVNPARGLFLKMGECCLCGHEHRSSSHTEVSVLDKLVATWSLGCLCHMHPDYRPLGNRWSQGFAYLNSGSDWSVENFKIVNGKVKPS